jgi:hypothetical protein
MKTKESEKTLEARLVREIEARGGMALKYTSQFHRGIPDRICLLPGGVTVFVELKSTGQKPTKLQDHAMKQLEKLGFSTRVIDSTESLDRLLWILDSAEKLRKIIHSQHLRDLPDSDKKFPESDQKFTNSPKN